MIFGRFKINPRMVELVVYMTLADLRAEASKTYINYLWWVVDPILSMMVFYVVFGLLFKRTEPDYVSFLLVGLVAWTWYSRSLSHASNSILSGKSLMNQVDMPKLVFPIVTLLTDFTKFWVVLMVLLFFTWVADHGLGIAYAALPLVILTQFLLCAALALLLAAAVPWLPDLKPLVDHLLHLQMFLSGVFFAAASIPEPYRFWFYLNPMAGLIEDYRAILLDGLWPHWVRLGTIAGLSLLVLILGVWLLRRLDRVYPRLVR